MKLAALVIGFIILISAAAYFLGIVSTENLKPFMGMPSPSPSQSATAGLANPASVNCGEKGGTLVIKELENGAQYGLCEFEDDQACEEWALFRGDCPLGGVKTTGFDNIGQKYCAWLGGQTLAVADSKCTLPDGTICPTGALYKGTCPSYDQ